MRHDVLKHGCWPDFSRCLLSLCRVSGYECCDGIMEG